ncbi:MAG: PAS domain S-box protein, partial [Halothece sp. Uz-M2-17]|nr:PAS domain S-box protein [Halothece sp. Uz-M2-17]
MMINRAPIVTPQALQSAIIRDPWIVSPETSIQEAIISMGRASHAVTTAKHQQNNRPLEVWSSCLVIVSEGRILGLVTHQELLKISHQAEDLQRRKIAEIVSPPVMTLQQTQLTDLLSVINLFQQPHLHHLPILDEQNQFVGLVTPESLIKVAKSVAFWDKWTVETVMKSDFPIVTAETPLNRITEQIITTDQDVIVIVNEDSPRTPQGVITAGEILQQQSVPTLLTSPVVTVQPQNSLLRVAEIMLEHSIRQVIVTGAVGERLGLVTARDLIATLHPQALYRLAENLNQQLDQQLYSYQSQLQAHRQSQKQTKIALEFSENRFHGIFENTFQFIGLLSPDGVLLEANQTALNAAGIQREDAVGRPFWETPWWQISAETQAQLRNAINRAAQGEFIRYEVEIWGANQTVIPIDFSLRPIQDDQGYVILLIPEGRDLTEAKRLEVERQQTVNLLQASKRRYASLVKASPVGIFRCDSVGNCVYTNQVASEILGLSSQEMKGRGWQNALHPEDREQVIAQWQRAIAHNQPFAMEYRFLRPDGSVRWVYGQSTIEQDRHEQIHGYVGTITDISDRKEVEIALETLIKGTATTTGQEFFSALVTYITQALNVSHVLISELADQELHLLAASGNGISPALSNPDGTETPCKRALREGEFYCHGSVQAEFPQNQELVTLGITSYFGIALRSSNGKQMGTLCILNNKPIPNADRTLNILRVFAARAAAELERQRANNRLQELNEQLEAMVEERTATLRKREAELQDFFDNAHDLIQSVSLTTGKFEYVNRSWRKVLGYSREEVASLTVFDVLHPDCHDHCQQVLTEMRNGRLPQADPMEVIFLSKAGQEIIVEGGINCRWEGEQPIATRAIFRDITQRKQTEREIRLLQERLEYLLNANPAIIYSCKPEGNNDATFISENITRILGYPQKEFAARANYNVWVNFIHPEDRDRVIAKASQVWEEDSHTDEYRFLHCKG